MTHFRFASFAISILTLMSENVLIISIVRRQEKQSMFCTHSDGSFFFYKNKYRRIFTFFIWVLYMK